MNSQRHSFWSGWFPSAVSLNDRRSSDFAPFQSIVENGKLWATHIRYLNDTSEQQLFERLFRARVEELIKTSSPGAKQRMHLWLERLKSKTVPYVICLSQDDGNRLSQRRGYAAQGGVSIGFKVSLLQAKLCRPRLHRLDLQQVRYVDPAGGKATNDIIDGLLQIDFDRPGSPNPAYYAETVSLHSSATFKHFAFEEEKEARLVLLQTTQRPKIRVRGSLMVPYLEVDIDQQSDALVEQVIVGPNAHQEQTAESIEGLLRLNGWNAVKVKCSDTPYRGW
jgi:hypothetical protein